MFEIEAIISMEIGLPSFRVEEYSEYTNFEWLQANLDLLKKNMGHAAVKMASYN